MFDWLQELVSGQPLTYGAIALAAGGDVLFPLIPSETIVITAAVLAAKGDLSIWLTVLAAAAGALAGDHASYLLGRKVGDPLARRLLRGEKGRARLEWGERAMRRCAELAIVVGRFIPGGRTASTFAAGTLEVRYRRFLPADAAAAGLWGAYAAMLGYLGGTTFQHSVWKPLAASLAAAGLIALGIEVWRQAERRRGRDVLGDPVEQ